MYNYVIDKKSAIPLKVLSGFYFYLARYRLHHALL